MIITKMKRFVAYMLDGFLPRHCLWCQNSTQQFVCQPCRLALPWLQQLCQYCAMPCPSKSCEFCKKQPRYFSQVFALFPYEKQIKSSLRALKFQQKLIYASLFGELLCCYYQTLWLKGIRADAVLPMPLHRKRLGQRGFNQAVELSRVLARQFRIPLLVKNVIRCKKTHAQSSLNFVARQVNMQEAFTVIQPLPKRVIIIDDVMTSGATLNSLAQVLLTAGVEKVYGIVIARNLLS
jgi:ComF family protein